MENTRKPQSADPVARVAAHLREYLFPGAHVVLGLSGGMDSVCLLHILAELAAQLRFSLRAVHVNHGISSNAGDWATFCEALCRRLGIPLAVESVDVAPYRHLGPEAAARAARWSALLSHDAEFLALAQHRDDQAETLLLQLMRGAGPAGLAGMAGHALPARFKGGAGQHQLRVLRPLLDWGRIDIEAFVRSRNLEWVEDESNSHTALDRNFLRHRVLPELSGRYPHAAAMIARSAGILGEASDLLTQLGLQDIAGIESGDALELRGLRALGEARARNALRAYCHVRDIPSPGFARIHEIWLQLREPRQDSRICIAWEGHVLRRYRDRIYIERHESRDAAGFEGARWEGEPSLPLMALDGMLHFQPEEGRGLSVEKLRSAPVTIRLRSGGERLRIDTRKPHRTLKNLWQEKGTPPWRRDRLPLLYCADELVCVPGIGDNVDWRAASGERGLIVTWQPFI